MEGHLRRLTTDLAEGLRPGLLAREGEGPGRPGSVPCSYMTGRGAFGGCQIERTSESLAVAGHEIVDAEVVVEAVKRVRDACGVPVGVTTSAEIEPDPARLDRLDPTLPAMQLGAGP